MDFRVETSDRDGTFVISLYGEFDLAAAESLPEWAASMNGQPRVEVDLTNLTFMDSSGLRAMLRLRELTDSEGRLLSLNVTPGSVVERIFELTGLTSRFNFT
jgi:anti-anti-sigma factor